jgi:hypothetical protein
MNEWMNENCVTDKWLLMLIVWDYVSKTVATNAPIVYLPGDIWA